MTSQQLLPRCCRLLGRGLLASALALWVTALPGCEQSDADRRQARQDALERQAEKVREEQRQFDEMAREAAEEEAQEAARRAERRLEDAGRDIDVEVERPARPGS